MSFLKVDCGSRCVLIRIMSGLLLPSTLIAVFLSVEIINIWVCAGVLIVITVPDDLTLVFVFILLLLPFRRIVLLLLVLSSLCGQTLEALVLPSDSVAFLWRPHHCRPEGVGPMKIILTRHPRSQRHKDLIPSWAILTSFFIALLLLMLHTMVLYSRIGIFPTFISLLLPPRSFFIIGSVSFMGLWLKGWASSICLLDLGFLEEIFKRRQLVIHFLLHFVIKVVYLLLNLVYPHVQTILDGVQSVLLSLLHLLVKVHEALPDVTEFYRLRGFRFHKISVHIGIVVVTEIDLLCQELQPIIINDALLLQLYLLIQHLLVPLFDQLQSSVFLLHGCGLGTLDRLRKVSLRTNDIETLR